MVWCKSDALHQLLVRHRPNLQHLASRRTQLGYIEEGRVTWQTLLEELNAVDNSRRSILLTQLYEEDCEYIAFSRIGDEECKCRNQMYHESDIFRLAACQHVTFRSTDGRLLLNIQRLEIPARESSLGYLLGQ